LLYKKTDEFNVLAKVFDYNGFALYCFRSQGKFRQILSGSGKERIVFSLNGQISANGLDLEEKDMAYYPSDLPIELQGEQDSVVFVAETDGRVRYDPYIKKYKDASRMSIGQTTYRRSVIVMVGEKDPANKFIAGYVEDSLGEWSSYPPHKHDDKPEAYVFYGVDPGFAMQAVLDGENESAYVVHDYDTVLIPKGYHPHVNTSLTGSCYAWIISAPPTNRNLAVEIHPAFKGVELGRSHLSINKS
jgi:5-deoxy-glucuronate isomerase